MIKTQITYGDVLNYVKEVIANDLIPEENTDEPDELGHYVQVSESILKAEGFEQIFDIWSNFEGWGGQSTYIPRLLDKCSDLVLVGEGK